MARSDGRLPSLAGWVIEGKYRLDARVGEGGFGAVYKGVHLAMGRSIAVKVLKLPPDLDTAARGEHLRSFRQEASLMRDLSSESAGVVQALDFGSVDLDGRLLPFLVLEWLDGATLNDWLEARGRRPMSPVEALALLDGALSGLAAANEALVAHRDVKPQNIFVVTGRAGSRTKVLDFGIAKLQQSIRASLALQGTGPGQSAFTMLYGAPEQFVKSRGATGTWTDVHAVALVLTEMIVGRAPYDADSVEQCMAAALSEERPTPARLGAPLGPELDEIFERSLALDPRKRPPTVGELHAQLLAACGERGVSRRAARAALSVSPATSPPPVLLSTHLAAATLVSREGAPPVDAAAASAPRAPALAGTKVALATFQPTASPPAPAATAGRRKLALLAGAAAATSLTVGGVAILQRASASAPASISRGAAAAPGVEIVDLTEITVRQYQDCVSRGRCKPSASGPMCNADLIGHEGHPINCVTYRQAAAYCAQAGARLLRPEQWNALASSCPDGGGAACADRANGTCEADRAGAPRCNGLVGLLDNVREWVDSPGPDRAAMGGAWRVAPSSAAATYPDEYQSDAVGFRCARRPP
ncbi:MAG: serine/threonine protein kinase [Polyangiaceae bacterium]|nr:serine/threonine protein kinase [Polyangiaceae bacterium]